jgi:hypothetical protein
VYFLLQYNVYRVGRGNPANLNSDSDKWNRDTRDTYALTIPADDARAIPGHITIIATPKKREISSF